jgi:hypothetical protein
MQSQLYISFIFVKYTWEVFFKYASKGMISILLVCNARISRRQDSSVRETSVLGAEGAVNTIFLHKTQKSI